MLYIDCANGVGAAKLQAMAPQLAEAGLQIELRNTGAHGWWARASHTAQAGASHYTSKPRPAKCLWRCGSDRRPPGAGAGVLNGECGSDFVQKDKALPDGFGGVGPGSRCCAVDGDADRLLYFSP